MTGAVNLSEFAANSGFYLSPPVCLGVAVVLLRMRRAARLLWGATVGLFLFTALACVVTSVILFAAFHQPRDNHLGGFEILAAPAIAAMAIGPVLLLFILGLVLVRPKQHL